MSNIILDYTLSEKLLHELSNITRESQDGQTRAQSEIGIVFNCNERKLDQQVNEHNES